VSEIEKDGQRLLLVVDGGGTRTRALVVPTGDVHAPASAKLEAGPSNLGQVGRAGLQTTIRELLDKLPPMSRNISAAVVGLAGIGRDAEKRIARDALRELFPKIPVLLRTDAELAYYGAFAFEQGGILVIAGTGSIAWTRLPNDSFLRAGGWGPILGDEGSGAWMGREVLRICLLESENDKLGSLANAVLKTLAISDARDILTLVYQRGFLSKQWAALAPLVFEYAEKDTSARDLIHQTGAALARLAKRLLTQMPTSERLVPVAVVGGLTAHWSVLKPPFLSELMKDNSVQCDLVNPIGDALLGGRFIAKEAGIR
jgi:glucosamine kinase